MNFKEKVIQICKQIPYGRVSTYGTVAILSGTPRGARIVGGILHHNYGAEEIAWWRIINREGYISIRCIDHPKELQKALLEEEGIEVTSDFMIDLEKYGWWGEELKA